MQRTFLYEWKDLDLRKPDQRPENGQLVLLHMTPLREAQAAPVYDVGRLVERNGKTCWKGAGPGAYVSVMKQVYKIRWCYAPEDR